MSHDRGCFRCFEDHPYQRAKSGECKEPDCPYKEEPMVTGTLTTKIPGIILTAGTDVKPKPKLKLSWSTINDAVETLAYMVRDIKPNLIVGVSRGGLIPATLLSHKLNLPLSIISVSAYEGTRRTLEKPLEVKGWDRRYDSPRTLIVDDILDSGDTYRAMYKVSYNADWHFASIVTKQPAELIQGYDLKDAYYFARVPKDTWVQFPWEQDEK